jgi:hypothetical protein
MGLRSRNAQRTWKIIGLTVAVLFGVPFLLALAFGLYAVLSPTLGLPEMSATVMRGVFFGMMLLLIALLIIGVMAAHSGRLPWQRERD